MNTSFLGRVYQAREEWDQALSKFVAAIECESSAWAYTELGWMHSSKKDFPKQSRTMTTPFELIRATKVDPIVAIRYE